MPTHLMHGVLAAALLASAPASAAILAQGAVAVAGGGPQIINLQGTFSNLPLNTEIELSVSHGTLIDALWTYDVFWTDTISAPPDTIADFGEVAGDLGLDGARTFVLEQPGLGGFRFAAQTHLVNGALDTARFDFSQTPFDVCAEPSAVPAGGLCQISAGVVEDWWVSADVMTDQSFTWTLSTIPEPVTWAMLLLGVLGVGAMTRLARKGRQGAIGLPGGGYSMVKPTLR